MLYDVIIDDSTVEGRFPVTNLFDVNGFEVDSIDEASTFVAMMPSGRWVAGKISHVQVLPRRHN